MAGGARMREEGVKVVFDVPEAELHKIAQVVADAGFEVHRYYYPDDEHKRGGSDPGWVRLGAERRMSRFTAARQRRVIAAFEALQSRTGFVHLPVGIDTWTVDGGEDVDGDRKPRRPLPASGSGAAETALPPEAVPRFR